MVAGMEPNAENKLFVGGCPATSGEDELRALFEKHGQVEEVFVMRGGSRSGMACAFVRFASQPMAQAAIDAIHGRITLPDALEPLVVRWADAPGRRKRDGREGNRSKRGGSGGMGGGGGARDISSGMEGWPPHMMMPNHVYGGYPQMMMAQGHPHMMAQNPMMQQHAGVGNSLGGPQQFFHQGVGVGNFPNGNAMLHSQGMGGYPQPQMMVYMDQLGQNGLGGQQHMFWHTQGPPSPSHPGVNPAMAAAMMSAPPMPSTSGGGEQAGGGNLYAGVPRPAEAPMAMATGHGSVMM